MRQCENHMIASSNAELLVEKPASQPMGSRGVDNGNVDNIIDLWRLEFGMEYARKERFKCVLN